MVRIYIRGLPTEYSFKYNVLAFLYIQKHLRHVTAPIEIRPE